MASMSLSGECQKKRSQHLLDTETTELQEETEAECAPFFVDLKSLPENQLDHLRQCGLLPRKQRNGDNGDNGNGDPYTFDVCLIYNRHVMFMEKAFGTLRSSFVSLDSSRPWILYWTLHGLDLMDRLPAPEILSSILSTLKHCWQDTTVILDASLVKDDPILKTILTKKTTLSDTIHLPAGGFGGGPGQLAHCATSYAAVLALCIIATCSPIPNEASTFLQNVKTPLYAWYLSLKQQAPSANAANHGGFRMHHDGEVDVRATYTILAVTSLFNMNTPNLTRNAVDYIAACQTYEGGFGGEPFSEAHGGYAFCAVAALQLLGEHQLDPAIGRRTDNHDAKTGPAIDIAALRGWLVRRQMSYEGGFAGRSNKLVDGCYSFWQGSALAIVSAWYHDKNKDKDPTRFDSSRDNDNDNNENKSYYHPSQDVWLSGSGSPQLLFDETMLQRYTLLCAQDTSGGLRDKPSKPRDFYHSCYNLSGLSVSQHFGGSIANTAAETQKEPSFGHPTLSLLAATHPCFNIRIERVKIILEQSYTNEMEWS